MRDVNKKKNEKEMLIPFVFIVFLILLVLLYEMCMIIYLKMNI